jgi:hypothetical protein
VVGDRVFKRVDSREVLVEEWLVGVVPQVLGGLELGRVDPLCQGKQVAHE